MPNQIKKFERCQECNMNDYIELSETLFQCAFCDTQYIYDDNSFSRIDYEKIINLRHNIYQAVGRELSRRSTLESLDLKGVKKAVNALKEMSSSDPFVSFFSIFIASSRPLKDYMDALKYALTKLEVGDGLDVLLIALKDARNNEGYYIRKMLEETNDIPHKKHYLDYLDKYLDEEGETSKKNKSIQQQKSVFQAPIHTIIEQNYHSITPNFNHKIYEGYWYQMMNWLKEWETQSSANKIQEHIKTLIDKFLTSLYKLDKRDLNEHEAKKFCYEKLKEAQNKLVMIDLKTYATELVKSHDNIENIDQEMKVIDFITKPEEIRKVIDDIENTIK